MNKKRLMTMACAGAVFCFLSGCEKQAQMTAAETEHITEAAETVQTEHMTEAAETVQTEHMTEAAETVQTEFMTEDINGLRNVEYHFRKEPLVVELDAGHGKGGGAVNERYGVLEREVNLQIALKLKEELETYENVTVYLTRDDASDIELEDRVKKAVDDGADVLISLHNNGTGTICDYYNGSTVLVARGAGNLELSEITQGLGCYILEELEAAGSENQGLMFRVTQDELYYDDGSLCDYYSIVRNCVKAGIPGIIIEHAFLDSEEDYQAFFADSEKIDRLALADARGIAGYYHLKKKDSDEIPVILENHTEKITLIVSDYYQDNTYLEKTFFVGALQQ